MKPQPCAIAVAASLLLGPAAVAGPDPNDALRDALSGQEAKIHDLFESNASAKAYDPILSDLSRLGEESSRGADEVHPRIDAVLAQRLATLQRYVTLVEDYLVAKADSKNTRSTLDQLILADTNLPVIPRTELLALRDQPDAGATALARATATELEDLEKRIQPLLDSARVPSDIDPLLKEVALDSRNLSSSDLGYTAASPRNRLEALRMLLERWQDYLGQLQAGNKVAAGQKLQELSMNSGIELYYPRSHLLALIATYAPAQPSGSGPSEPRATYTLAATPAGPSAPAEPVPKEPALPPPNKVTVETLDDLAAANSFARPLPPSMAGVPVAAAHLARAAHTKSGDQAIAELGTAALLGNLGAYAEPLETLRDSLLREALPRCEATKGAPFQSGETTTAYLLRQAGLARDTADYDRAYRLIVIGRDLSRTGPLSDNPFVKDQAGYDKFFGGENEEAAGQWAEAVRSYNEALKVPSHELPVVEIGKRLTRLQHDHPDDYSRGLEPAMAGFLAGRMLPRAGTESK